MNFFEETKVKNKTKAKAQETKQNKPTEFHPNKSKENNNKLTGKHGEWEKIFLNYIFDNQGGV